jgi:alpha-beta hydrolase superfamily lysophospholipase
MCNRNIHYAKQIDATPVIIFQGVSDMLVKPKATYDLFGAIKVKDKSFVMVGNAEHLIFEEGCFTPAVLKGLVAWMESHLTQQVGSLRSD